MYSLSPWVSQATYGGAAIRADEALLMLRFFQSEVREYGNEGLKGRRLRRLASFGDFGSFRFMGLPSPPRKPGSHLAQHGMLLLGAPDAAT